MTPITQLPVAILGGGPVGLAAAAHLAVRGERFVLFEAGGEVGASVRNWGHVTMFSPWRFNIDRTARALLQSIGWRAPNDDVLPTGDDLVDQDLAPLARHPLIAPSVQLNARVIGVGRKDFDKVRTSGRDGQPFEVHLEAGPIVEVRAVLDATGTWTQPNPAGSGGRLVVGEKEFADRVWYGMPAVHGPERARFAGKRVMVVGSGHSAINVVLDLLALGQEAPGTEVLWVMRRENLDTVWGGGAGDALEARGLLGARAKQAVEGGRLSVVSPYRIRSIAESSGALGISGVIREEVKTLLADEIIVSTGFRPNLDMLKEIRLSTNPWLECTAALGPLIDPNEHSCGTVRPHGARELAHPEKDFFVVGMKSYGRAPTFLLATGFEQVRSVTALLAGDLEAAARVELELPETGVCSAPTSAPGGGCCGAEPIAISAEELVSSAASCCGGPAPAGVDACCVQDADAKAAGDQGCGCGPAPPQLLQVSGTSRR